MSFDILHISMINQKNRTKSNVSHAAFKQTQNILSSLGANPKIAKGKSGEPICIDDSYYCSWSYSKGTIASIVSTEKVGIDIEVNQKRKNWDRLSRYLWSTPIEDLNAFYKRWCITEAWSKFQGSGLVNESWKINILGNEITHDKFKNNRWSHVTYQSSSFTLSIVQDGQQNKTKEAKLHQELSQVEKNGELVTVNL